MKWEIPGGGVEAGESPYAAVVRELQEELALPVRPGLLLVTDWVPPRPDRTPCEPGPRASRPTWRTGSP
ncbi:NUDIX domain-containing protein [Winogradskya consettensis]|uniref:NUDIX domain-containing protein n=1 Tax=Winogradskya consettensis TaxID=113560 RepID=UPI001BB41F3D